MRAAVFRKVGVPLAIEMVADPAPGPGEVVVRVERCGVCGSDLQMSGQARYEGPGGFVFGHEFAGEVVETGAGVADIGIGARVAVMPVTGCGACAACRDGAPAACAKRRLEQGGYAEYALGRARELAVIPDHMPLSDGALAEPLAVALHGIRLAEIARSDRVLVIGAGPIGLSTAFWAARYGAEAVVAARADHEARALAMGAAAYLRNDDGLADALVSRWGGPADKVFDCAGAAGTIARAIDLVARGGTVLVQGIFHGADTFRPQVAIGKEARVQFSAFFTLDEFNQARDCLAQPDLGPRAMVATTVALDDLPGRFEAMKVGPSAGKLLVAPGEAATQQGRELAT